MFKKIFDKDKNLKYDFLPSALEIVDKPASPLGKIIIYIIAIFILSIIIWASVAKIDKIVVSSGNIVPVGGIKTIDSNINGKILSINKSEGDVIKSGDEIITLENSSTDKVDKMGEEINLNKLELDIILSKISGADIDEIYSKYELDENKIEEIKIRENIEKEKQDKEYKDYLESIESIDKDIKEKNDELAKLNDEYQKMTDVDKFIYGSNTVEEIKSKQEQIQQLEKNKQKTIENWKSNQKEKNLQYVQDRNNKESEIKDSETNLNNLKNNNANYIITSPVDGIILKSNYNTVGSYINQSKNIVEVLPDNTELELETLIPNKDIARIKEGQEVTIKVEAYDYQSYGTLTGEVKYISPTSFVDEKQGVVYKVKVKFNKEQNENIKILPGMTTTLEIKSDKKRIIDEFLEPFRKNIDNAFKG